MVECCSVEADVAGSIPVGHPKRLIISTTELLHPNC